MFRSTEVVTVKHIRGDLLPYFLKTKSYEDMRSHKQTQELAPNHPHTLLLPSTEDRHVYTRDLVSAVS